MLNLDLSGRIALVTGGGQGLGQATAVLLHQAGASVVVNYLDDPDGIGRSKAEHTVAPFGSRGLAVAADVRSRADLQSLMQQIQDRFGALDLLINNAAILRDRSLKNLSDEDWDKIWVTPEMMVTPPANLPGGIPPCSPWIGMNMLSVNQNLVIIDENQGPMMKELKKYGIDTIGLPCRQARTMSGGFHCQTLDVKRKGTLESYF